MNLNLSAPSTAAWVIAVVLGLLGLLAVLGVLPLGIDAFWFVFIGLVILLVATVVRGM